MCQRKVGPKNLHLFGFSMTSRLNGEYLLHETWHRQGRWKVPRVSYVVAKFHVTGIRVTQKISKQILDMSCHVRVSHPLMSSCVWQTSTSQQSVTRLADLQVQSSRRLHPRTLGRYTNVVLLGLQAYLSADLCFTTDSFSFFFLSPPNLGARWTKLIQNLPHARK